MVLCPSVLRAVPAYPVRKTVTMPDGTVQVVTLQGDEHLSFYQSEDGRRGRMLGDGRFEPLAEDEFVAMRQRAAARRIAADGRRTARQAPAQASRRVSPYTGQQRGLVILVSFSDLDFTVSEPNASYRRFFNESGYREGGMTGSVHDYFLAQSYGQFDLTFDVYGPVKIPRPYSYYGRNTDDNKDVNVKDMVTASLQQMDSQIDYTRYDWDGDGEVDQVFFIYAGYGEAQGAPENTIWPHESTIAGQGLTLDGVRLGTYGCSSELRGSSGNQMDGVGTACHEFTHCLGIMDMYDTQYNGGYGMASWDLMASGSYNDYSRTPAGYTAYERWACGWLEPKELTDMTYVRDMAPVTDAPEAYVLYNEKNRNEYYLLENRQLTGWDKALPGHGMLVVHVDYDEATWRGNTINVNPTHQRVTVVPADNNTTGDYAGMAGDPYPGTTGNHSLTNYTVPAATLFNRNTDRGYFLNKPVEAIQESSEGRISFVAMHPALDVPQLRVEEESTTAFTLRWEAVEGASRYEVHVTETPASKHDIAECLIMKEDFAQCVTKSTGFTDISANLSKYLSGSGWAGGKLYTSPSGLRFGTSSEAGYLQTGGYQIPESGEVTLVMDLAPFAAGTAVEGEVRFIYNGRTTIYQTVPLNVTEAGRYVFHCTGLTGVGAISVHPASRMYITYMALYEGYWTEEEMRSLNVKEEVPGTPRRITTRTLTTADTFLRMDDVTPSSTYTFVVRALTDDGVASQWSDAISYCPDGTGVGELTMGSAERERENWLYDLSGRRMAPRDRHPRGIYIRNGRKFLLK